MNVTQVGVDVAAFRRDAGLSQVELARRAGTTQAVISRLENGLKLPGYEVMDRIAGALGERITVSFGSATALPSRDERRRRVRAVLGDYEFDPWAREPSPAEARSLEADGLGRERFARR
jgi:transcriptional regulator with XRE-family HTH domain